MNDVLQRLSKFDFEMEARDYPPVAIAALTGNYEIVKLLLDKYGHLHKDFLYSLVRVPWELKYRLGLSYYTSLCVICQDFCIKTLDLVRTCRKSVTLRYLVSKRMDLEYKSHGGSAAMSDDSVLEQLCRGVYHFREGETLHSVVMGIFERHGYRMHSDFAFHGGRSPITYAAMFGQTDLIRLLIEKCERHVNNLDNVSSRVSSRDFL